MEPDDFSEDEQYYKHRSQVLKYSAWRYSLVCPQNVVQVPVEHLDPTPKKESPTKASRLSNALSPSGLRSGRVEVSATHPRNQLNK